MGRAPISAVDLDSPGGNVRRFKWQMGGPKQTENATEQNVNRQPPFLGTFVNKVDQKGRVSVPAPFRQILGAHSFHGIVAFQSYKADAIEGCSLDFMSDLSESVAGIDLFSDAQEHLAATLFAESYQLPWDSGGRIQLPQELLTAAKINDTAAFVGMGKTFRIWEPKALKAFQVESRDKARRSGLSLTLIRPREGE